ncbi:MAG: ATP-dependent DNA helicase [Alphaproteobacteria bacterium]
MAAKGTSLYTFAMSDPTTDTGTDTGPDFTTQLRALNALVAGPKGATVREPDGTIRELSHAGAVGLVKTTEPLVCHLPATAARMGADPFKAYDILELAAFTRPATPLLPTPGGLAQALGLPRPHDHAAEAGLLVEAAALLLDELTALDPDDKSEAAPLARVMARGGWIWAPMVLSALGSADGGRAAHPLQALAVWERLGEWSDQAPEPPPASHGVEPAEARERLARLLGEGAEARPQQADYASAATAAFAPMEKEGEPHMVLAEAGTGVGKTLGYIAPASLWAEKNQGAVWISTFTRNLQRQIDGELDRLFPDPVEKELKVVVRKGRENYFCLLNMEEAVNRLEARADDAVVLGLMARWARQSRDGDMVGGDFPAWLGHLFGFARTLGLADRRGECIYSACAHYHKCFVERTIRRARRARIVVANHALVMAQAALGGLDDATLPARYVFDEGHHLFNAADGAFSAHLSGRDTAELRRWLLGAEATRSRPGRARGLARRIGDMAARRPEAEAALAEVLEAARALPGEGWLQRLTTEAPRGPAEKFLGHVRRQVLARAGNTGALYGIEADPAPPVDGLIEVATALNGAFEALARPLAALAKHLAAIRDEDANELESSQRQRIEGVLRSLKRRAAIPIDNWRAMLESLSTETPPEFVDWFALERDQGRETDIAMHRHWTDPTQPFAETVARTAHGLLVTSATLRDGSGDNEADWHAAEMRTGALHFERPAIRALAPSPFDYAALTRIIVITDVARDDPGQVAAAYRTLFTASAGGALGLFTSISRLRASHQRMAPALDDAGIALYAQHVDGLDTSTLVDIFRAEEDSCLLGTDAVRDGVDVPGRSLRLIVFDRVPWPRPDILHRARRLRFGGHGYDEMIARLRLKQAYGRLVRRADDRGVFVMLDSRMPSRFKPAFPPEVAIQRMGLAAASRLIGEFIGENEFTGDNDGG